MEKEYVDCLKESPVFAMSLSSKELFHSNFWAWLINYDHAFAKVFFDDIETDNIEGIKREQGNRDITIWMKDKKSAYVIENKLKSLPRKDQLEGYEDDLNKKNTFVLGCITGLSGSLRWINDTPKWRYKNYQEIAEKINIILEQKTDADNFKRQLILEYVSVISGIYSVVNGQLKEFGDSLLIKPIDDCDFSELRLNDILQKLNADTFVAYLEQHLLPFFTSLTIESNFTNGTSLVDVCFETERKTRIGIQIQGGQYRRYAKKEKPCKIEDVFKEFNGYGWFGEKNKKMIFDHETSMKNEYCKYDTNKYSFVYQYYNLSDNAVPFSALYEQIKTDLNKAKDIIEKYNVQ